MLFNFLKYVCFFVYLVEISNGQTPCSADNAANTLLTTLNGRVQGACVNIPVPILNSAYDVISWKSVPYAQPPINANRFRAPAAITNWSDTKDGTVFSKACLQNGDPTSSEDCLYLNIYVTASAYRNRATALKPILFWIHGGSL